MCRRKAFSLSVCLTGVTSAALLVLGAGTLLIAFLYSKTTPAWAPRYLAVIVGPLLLLFGLGIARAVGEIGSLLIITRTSVRTAVQGATVVGKWLGRWLKVGWKWIIDLSRSASDSVQFLQTVVSANWFPQSQRDLLYLRLLDMSEEIRNFIEVNNSQLKSKE